MAANERLFVGLLMMALNPITALIVIPLLMLLGGALVLGWLFIKSVELIERLIRKATAAPTLPAAPESDIQQQC